MKIDNLGFIGGGRITKAFLQASANELVNYESVVVYDTNPEVLAALKVKYPDIKVAQTIDEVAQQPTLIIALHPPVVMETIEKIAPIVSSNAYVISLAPKITIENIASKLATKNIVRAIPNATSYINQGYNPVAYSPEMEKLDRKQVKKLLLVLGRTFKTDEAKLEAYAIVSAMLPTYFWFQFEEMEKIAQQCGLSEEEAAKTIKATLKRTIKTYYNSGLSPAEVMDLIPVKPIGEHETEIREIYQTKLMGLYGKIKA